MTVKNPRYLVRRYRTWNVRIIIPPVVRHLFLDAQGKPQQVIKRSTHESDVDRAQIVAAPMIAAIQHKIAQAKENLAISHGRHATRMHICDACGMVLDRDVEAALNMFGAQKV
jgi:hypothetical protein